MRRETQAGDYVKGALIGGILGGVAALLIAPKSGKELREDICDGYNCITEKTQSFADDIKEKGRHLLHPFQEEIEEECDTQSLLIGGAVGAVIGAVAALLLAPDTGERVRASLGDKYEEIRDKAEDFVSDLDSRRQNAMENLEDWKETLGTIVQKLTSARGHKGKNHSKIDDILDWANLGMSLFQKFQKRR